MWLKRLTTVFITKVWVISVGPAYLVLTRYQIKDKGTIGSSIKHVTLMRKKSWLNHERKWLTHTEHFTRKQWSNDIPPCLSSKLSALSASKQIYSKWSALEILIFSLRASGPVSGEDLFHGYEHSGFSTLLTNRPDRRWSPRFTKVSFVWMGRSMIPAAMWLLQSSVVKSSHAWHLNRCRHSRASRVVTQIDFSSSERRYSWGKFSFEQLKRSLPNHRTASQHFDRLRVLLSDPQ